MCNASLLWLSHALYPAVDLRPHPVFKNTLNFGLAYYYTELPRDPSKMKEAWEGIYFAY